MNILQINAVGQTKSTGRNCKEIAEYINHNTEDVCYTAFAEGTPDRYNIKIGSRVDRKLHSLLSRITGKQAHFSYFATKKLLRFIKEKKIDVVVLNNLHANYIHLPLLLKYLAKNDIATVAVLHDCWFFTGKCCHYTLRQCYRWIDGCHHCPKLSADNPSWFFDRTKGIWREKKKLFSKIPRLAVIGVSDWITGEAKRSILQNAKIIRRVHNWIDLDLFTPNQSGIALRQRLRLCDKKIVLGVAAIWSKRKGLDDFVKLADSLGEEYQVVLVGHMPNDTRLPDNLLSIKATDSVQELAAFYNMADVFVTLSLEETFGKVSAEALACGTPVICFDSTANKELVGEGCGKVVALSDTSTVENSIREICERGKDSYSAACRRYAEENFKITDRIEDYLQVFHRIQN